MGYPLHELAFCVPLQVQGPDQRGALGPGDNFHSCRTMGLVQTVRDLVCGCNSGTYTGIRARMCKLVEFGNTSHSNVYGCDSITHTSKCLCALAHTEFYVR